MRCWEWDKCKTHNGYGRIRNRLVHRVVYEEIIGTIPAGLQIDHLCSNRACYNPEHLEAVTPKENIRRGRGHGSETHCPHGHPYTGDNLIIEKGGYRKCWTCKKANDKKSYTKNREKRKAAVRNRYRRRKYDNRLR